MTTHRDMLQFQAEHHPLEGLGRFESSEEYCLYLMHLRAYEEIAALAGGKTVLDLGCNNGWGTRVMSGTAARVVGVDVSDVSLDAARRDNAAPNIEYLKVDGKRLPFADGEFDVLASCQVIEHVDDYAPYLGEIVRVLKADGVAVFTTPNARIRLDPGMKPWFPFHVREFSGAELERLLRDWFGRVEVRGLFATPELYDIEFKRVQRSRELARRRAKAVLPPYWELRTRAIEAAKAVLPDRFVKGVQRIARKAAGRAGDEKAAPRPQVDPGLVSRHSTGDFSYGAANVDASLDLIAVCRKGPSR
jgi:SAM-dependent methyltransferase